MPDIGGGRAGDGDLKESRGKGKFCIRRCFGCPRRGCHLGVVESLPWPEELKP